MSEIIEQQVSKEQALMWVSEVKRGLDNVRHYLLKIRDTKAWQALGYENFAELGKKEFGFSRAYSHQLAKAAEIEISLNLSAIADQKQIPEGQLRPLSKVPEDERKTIWEAAQQAAITLLRKDNLLVTEKLNTLC